MVRNTLKIATFGLSILFSQAIYAHSVNWSQITLSDLNEMHHLLLKNHPATAGFATAAFSRWFEPGYKLALLKALKVQSYGGYLATLEFYANGFNSEHLSVTPLRPFNNYSWPGFLVAKRDNKYKVVYVEPGLADKSLLGSNLVDCDNNSPTAMMKKMVVPYTSLGYLNNKQTWDYYVPTLFIDKGNPWYHQAHQCWFKRDNVIQLVKLHWMPIEQKRIIAIQAPLAYGPRPKFSTSLFNNGVWITIPTFDPNEIVSGVKAEEALNHIIHSVANYRDKSFIVLDLRGNGGGNSAYSQSLIKHLYTNTYLNSLSSSFSLNQSWRAVFRASEDNLNYLKVAGQKKLAALVEQALAQHQSILTITLHPAKDKETIHVCNPVKAQVFVLTDGRCTSDCWLFVRSMLQLPHVVQVGRPTHLLTPYTMANPIVLSSGLAVFRIPMQMFLSPLDHMGEVFVPFYQYLGDFAKTHNLHLWLLGVLSQINHGHEKL